jgi:hypothetical protein
MFWAMSTRQSLLFMSKTFIIRNANKNEQTITIEVDLLVGEEHYRFTIGVNKLGFSTPAKLDKILMREPVKVSQKFITILYEISEGKLINFPIVLNHT